MKEVFFGLHEIEFYEPVSKKKIGKLEVLKGSTLTVTSNQVAMEGGNSKVPWDVQTTNYTAEIQFKSHDCPVWFLGLMHGLKQEKQTSSAAPANKSKTYTMPKKPEVKEFGALITATYAGKLCVIDVFRAKANSFPINFDPANFSEIECTCKILNHPKGIYNIEFVEAA